MATDLMQEIMQSQRLPTLPAVALEVIGLVEDPDVDVRLLGETISHDPALSAKILKTVNSSFYGQSRSVGTISQAVIVLGLNSLKALALGFTLVNGLKKVEDEQFDFNQFWKRCLYSAVAARQLAEHAGLPQREEVFLGSLLQDLGVLAMDRALGERYQALLDQAGDDHRQLQGLERAELATDHAAVGAALAEQWRLPRALTQCIQFHEQPQAADTDMTPMVRCVAAGNLAADVYLCDSNGEALRQLNETATEWFDFTHAQTHEFLAAIADDAAEVKRLFELPIDDLEEPQIILTRANDALLQINLQIQHVSSRLEQQNRELQHKAATDGLTGLANRRSLDAFIHLEFETARTSHDPLSLIMVDVDHFKQLNDNHGHQSGDHVLVSIGNVLRNTVCDPALAARYGGEEFLIVLPGHDTQQAAAIAETLRTAIAEMRAQTDDGLPLQVTASLGVATFQAGNFDLVANLFKAADHATYTAKAAGRNCVRAFDPDTSGAASTSTTPSASKST